MASQVAERYGQALFELAQEENCLLRWQQQAKDVIALLRENPKLITLLKAVRISAAQKKQEIETLFQPLADRQLRHFLCLLIDKKRIGSAVEMLQVFVSLVNQQQGVQEGIVISARPLPASEIQRLQHALSERSGKRTELINRVDPRCISGVRVIVDNEVIDASMKTKIERLKQELLKESR